MLVGAAAPWPNRVDFFDVAVPTHLGWPNNPLSRHAPGWLADANALVAPVGIALVLASLMSLLPRWRRSTGDEREQIKWFGLAALLFGVELMFGFIQFVIVGMSDEDATGDLMGNALFHLILVGIPVAIGLGVVRYRLYEIDAYISRTLVFGGLAVFIALAYVLGVMLVGGSPVSRPVDGCVDMDGARGDGRRGSGIPSVADQAPVRRQPARVRRPRPAV